MAAIDEQTQSRPYPVRVTAQLDPQLSRWLWLVKWLLAIPHYVVLWFLWIAFAFSSIFAFFAIVFTARFPRGLFDFNVGVMRWTWRVSYYAYGALGTDRYPPFTLEDVADYPAHFEVDYPERLSRGLVLVKWWLLALPHYLVVGILISGGLFAASHADDHPQPFILSGGLVGLLVLFAGLALLFTGRYPRTLFDIVIGLQRWVLRVAAYAALMTDVYPPFRLDQGGGIDTSGPPVDASVPSTPSSPSQAAVSGRRAGPLIAGILSLVLAFVTGLGAGSLWLATKTLPDDEGFFTAPAVSCNVDGYAVVSEPIELNFSGLGGLTPREVLGDARVTVRSRSGSDVFVGVASAELADAYLDGVATSTLGSDRGDDRGGKPVCTSRQGTKPSVDPGSLTFWSTSAQGAGTQTLTWPFEEGDWTVVVMNADGSAGLDVTADAGATFPGISLVVAGLLILTALFLLLGLAMLIGSGAARSTAQPPSPS